MPPKQASKPSPKSRRSADAEDKNSGFDTEGMGTSLDGKTPSKVAAAAAAAAEDEDENEAVEEFEEIEMPIEPYFKRLLKDLVGRLGLSI